MMFWNRMTAGELRPHPRYGFTTIRLYSFNVRKTKREMTSDHVVAAAHAVRNAARDVVSGRCAFGTHFHFLQLRQAARAFEVQQVVEQHSA